MILMLYSLMILTIGTEAFVSYPFRKRDSFPNAISVTPSANWEGIDGLWNTFPIRVGSPPQVVRVSVSTKSQQTWVIDPGACIHASDKNACFQSRGGVFARNTSNSWQSQGKFDLDIENDLNMSGNAVFGYDDVGLGFQEQKQTNLKHQIIGSLISENFWYGHLGIQPKPTNLTRLDENIPSLMSTLKSQKFIPSISWGFTQGASYRYDKVQASLTLGGYDASRITANNMTFPLAPDKDRDIIINLNSISSDWSSVPNSNTSQLLESPIYTFIDSTISELWLPESACVRFERAFGLTFDSERGMYTISDEAHKNLVAANPNITFSISAGPLQNNNSIGITFPYAAFNHIANPPYMKLTDRTRYFPIRKATNDSEYTLGKTFLQEAYLTVDWERQNFSISQIDWSTYSNRRLVAIMPQGSNRNTSANPASSLSPGLIGGIVAAVVALIAIIAALSVLLYRSNKRQKLREKEASKARSLDDIDTQDRSIAPKPELDAGNDAIRTNQENEAEIQVTPIPQAPVTQSLVEAPDNGIYELPGDQPRDIEAVGREDSETEAQRVQVNPHPRAQIPPNPHPATDPTPKNSDDANEHTPVSPVVPSSSSTAAGIDDSPEISTVSPITATNLSRNISQALHTQQSSREMEMNTIEPINPTKQTQDSNKTDLSATKKE